MEASPVKLFSKSFSSIKQTDSTLIFETLKSVSCQETETVYIDEVLDLLKSICEGFAKPKIVENIVYHYAREAGILSEISYFNEREFKELMNRLIDEWFEAVDRDGDGLITKKVRSTHMLIYPHRNLLRLGFLSKLKGLIIMEYYH